MKFQDSDSSVRIQLEFTSEVLSNFDFLIMDYGFKCVRADITFVRFESRSLFINVYHGRRSHELGVEIGELTNDPDVPESWCTIGEIMDFFHVRKEQNYTFFQSSNPDDMKVLVKRLAEYVKDYAGPILNGNLGILKKLQTLNKEKSDAYIRDMNLRHIRKDAEVAWHQRNYVRFVEIYGPIENDLTLVESKKLAYARKKLNA